MRTGPTRFLAGLGAISLVVLGVSNGSAGAVPLSVANPPNLQVVQQVTPEANASPQGLSSQLAQTDPALLKLTGTAPTPVMVKLDYDPLASYDGSLPGLAATSPQVTGKKLDVHSAAAVAYSSHISSVDNSFVAALHQAIPSAVVGQSYSTVYGGVSVKAPANQLAALAKLPGVVAIQADALHQVDQADQLGDSSLAGLADSATLVNDDDASFIGANAAYSALGSSATAGAGIIVANVDTGVWPEHPSFAARPDLGTPPPTPDGHARACNFGTDPLTDVAFTCNNKLIGGQVFLDTYNANIGDDPYPTSARDSEGHGTHTLSTAAGNPLASADLFGVDRAPVTGIAPGAFVMAYKALGPQGGFDSDLVAAIEQAVLDGANVINYSVGPSSPQSAYTSPDDLAFLDAYNAGVFVSASAGNSGPGASTVEHLGPWETTVGASTLARAFESTATLTATGGAHISVTGDSIMPGISTATPVVNASSLAGYDSVCSKPAPPNSFTGKIVVCVRGGVDANGVALARVVKGYNVAQGGAAGMFLINPVVEDVETDNHFLPAVQFDHPAGSAIESFLAANSGVIATFTTGSKVDGQGDVMAAFSSRGPGGDFLKPDIVAPGVQILAGDTPTPATITDGPPGQLFQAIAGTSMAAPHIAGSGALVLALHPGWTPDQVKSALMMTATTAVVEADGTTPAGVLDDGAGRVSLAGVVDPGVTLNVTRKQMDAVLTDPIHRIDLNEPSVYDASLPGRVTTTRTFTNVSNRSLVFQVSATSDLAGSITVSPTVIAVAAGHSATVSITLDGTKGTAGQFYTGEITLTQVAGSRLLHLPVAFSPSNAGAATLGSVSLTSSCSPSVIHVVQQQTTCTATAVNNALVPATVKASTSWTNNLNLRSTSPSATNAGAQKVSWPSQTLSAAKPAVPEIGSGSSPFGYFDLSQIGVPIRPVGDETITNFNVPSFIYAGQTYSSIGIVSDGYAVVGGGDNNDISPQPQTMPDPARPNNVLAPLWTDLDGGNGTIPGQGLRIAPVSADGGVHNWLAIQLNEHVFGTSIPETYEIWIGLNGTEDVSYAYDPNNLPTNPGIPFNVGAENFNGSGGSNFAGLPTGDLVVQSTPAVPGGTASFSVVLRGNRVLPNEAPSTVETDMTTSISRDTSVSKAQVQVVP